MILATAPGHLAEAASGGGDTFGYTWIDSAEPGLSYDFEDISGSGMTSAVSTQDDGSENIPIGFTFTFYGTGYSDCYVSSNGFLSFAAAGGTGFASYTDVPIPTAGDPNRLIAGWWDDLNPSAGGTIYYETLGSAPNRRFIVQFEAVQEISAPANVNTFQFKLFEGSDIIEIHYLNVAGSFGDTSTIGIENDAGTDGLQYFHADASTFPTPTPFALAFLPPIPAPTIDTTDRFAWGENIGWTNWRWDTGTPGEGATIGQFFCGGLIWGENVGWIDLGDGAPADGIEYANTDASDFGVNHDGAGGLSGLAWGENIGWITFGQGVTDPPRIDFATGEFSGYVYGENIGWIDLGSNGTHFVKTNGIDAGPDTDGDMLADAWELEKAMAAGLGAVLTHLDKTTDSDGDGESDFFEYLADSNPFDALDALRIVDFGVISGGPTEFPGPGPIIINDNATATPYPSTITVSGLIGTVTAVRVKLDGFSHTYPDDVDVFLVGPGGQVSAVLSDAGLSTPVVNANLVFDDGAATVIPDSMAITSGTYAPANYDPVEPLPPGGTGAIGTNLTALAAGGANGDWKLFVSEDDAFGDTGSITSWSVVIETDADDITLEWTSSPRRLYDLGSSTDLDPFTVDFSDLAPDPGPTTAIIFNDPLVPRKYWRVGAKLPLAP